MTKKTRKPDLPRLPKQWRIWLDNDLTFATERLTETGSCPTMFVIHRKDGSLLIVGTPFTSPEQKHDVRNFLRLACIAYDAVAVTFISEAWVRMLNQRSGEGDAAFRTRADAIAPSQAEDRREVVSVMLTYRDEGECCQTVGAMREIVRDAAGKPSGVVALAGCDDGPAIDRTAILSDATPPPDIQACVEAFLKREGPAMMQRLGIA